MGCIYLGICAYKAEPKSDNATRMTSVHFNGPCFQGLVLDIYSNTSYSKATGTVLNKKTFYFLIYNLFCLSLYLF